MQALKVEDISKNFGGLQVLQNINFNVDEGERLAIIGPNGAGKTTLLNVLSGELRPTTGSIYFFGREISDMAIHRRVHLGMAHSFQLNRLFPNLTTLDNVLLALQGTRRSRFQMLRANNAYAHLFTKARDLLQSTGLWEKKNDPVKTLSYGEQRQMEIILALASEPKILLLDEPTAGLSIAESVSFVDGLRNLAGNITVLFIAHDMDVIFGLADRIIVLDFGKMIAQGTPKEIQANTTVKGIYLGMENDTGNSGTA
jgi:branched-chain amino acid transport system ATP-binding protein